MPDSNLPKSVWSFSSPLAQLRDGRWSSQVDVTSPHLGLREIRYNGAPQLGQLLCVTPTGSAKWPAFVADAYVRGRDLVAVYESADGWPYAPHIYWRAEQADAKRGVLASLSLLVSIQTNMLDTHPRVDVTSHLPADEVLRVTIGDGGDVHVEAFLGGEQTIHPRADVCCVLRRLSGGKLSYAEFMPASDFRQLSVDFHPPHADPNSEIGAELGDCRTQWELFAEFLEKGVIRRARLQVAIVDRQNDLELAAECCRTLKQRPLPLTT